MKPAALAVTPYVLRCLVRVRSYARLVGAHLSPGAALDLATEAATSADEAERWAAHSEATDDDRALAAAARQMASAALATAQAGLVVARLLDRLSPEDEAFAEQIEATVESELR